VTTTRIEKLYFYPFFLFPFIFFIFFPFSLFSLRLHYLSMSPRRDTYACTHTADTYLGPLAHFPSAFALIIVAFLPVHRLFDPVARFVRYSGSIRILTVHVSPLHRCAKWKRGWRVFKNLNNVKYLREDLYSLMETTRRQGYNVHIYIYIYLQSPNTIVTTISFFT